MGRLAVVAAAGLLSGACIPYTVGTTAQPLLPGEMQPTLSWYVIPNGVELWDSTRLAFTGIDLEVRRGLEDGASDVGVRIPSLSGLIINYKRRLGSRGDFQRPALAVLVGLGFVNFGQHVHGEASLLASGRERGSFTPYGGLRIMQVVPLTEGAVSDSPTAGGFAGVRIGRVDLGVSPEVGVYYDHSALGIRRRAVIVVPAITLHGAELIRMLRGGFRSPH